MCCVEVTATGASFEHSNAFIILDWEVTKEANKADFVIDLVKYELIRIMDPSVDCITFNSGLDDIAATGCLVLFFCVLRQWSGAPVTCSNQHKVLQAQSID